MGDKVILEVNSEKGLEGKIEAGGRGPEDSTYDPPTPIPSDLSEQHPQP